MHLGRIGAVLCAFLIAGALVVPLPSFDPMPQMRGTVRVQTPQGSKGTGVAIGGGYILTASHVVDDTIELPKPYAMIREFAGKHRVVAQLLWQNSRTDIALLQTDEPILARKLRCSPPVFGEPLTIVGYPSITGYSPYGPIITHGVVSSMVQPDGRMNGHGEFFITDASVQPGNSGGPVFDQNGEILGIAIAMFGQYADEDKEKFFPSGYSIVVPSSTICKFLGRA